MPAIRIPSDPLPEPKRPSPTLAAVPTPPSHPVHREPAIRIVPPAPRSATNWPAKERRGNVTFASTSSASSGAATTGAEPRRLNVPTRVVNIKDLPKAKTSDGFRLVSADEVPGKSAVVRAAPTSSSPRANYGYADDYSWLRGRLEYSQVGNRWKLRYIPVDGQTDRHGGSVTLADPKLLGGCERGDFVEIHGQIGQQDPKRGFAPNYHVAKVKRLK